MESAKSTEMMMSDPIKFEYGVAKHRKITIALLVVAVIILIVGIVLIAVAASDKKSEGKLTGSSSKQGVGEEGTTAAPPTTTKSPPTTKSSPTTKTPRAPNRCDFSEEAQRVGLAEFLSRVKATYYKLHPYDVYWDPDVTDATVKAEYVAYDPTPAVIKSRTDTAWALLKEINGKAVNTNALKPRERKALAQVKHYLQHIFGQPYDVNYYAGDWMMGPNLFCWQEICYHGYGIHNGIGLYHKPNKTDDVVLIEKKLQTHKEGILQYIENMKMGVLKGMIRSKEECEAGINAIKRRYLNVSLHNATGEVHVLMCCAVVVPNVTIFHFFSFLMRFNLRLVSCKVSSFTFLKPGMRLTHGM